MKRIIASLRARDFFALLCAILLVHLSKLYSHGSESIEGTIELSFYSEYTSHIHRKHKGQDLEYDVARPVQFDMDGDGIVEAVVVPSSSSRGGGLVAEDGHDGKTQYDDWSLNVLDLRPLHNTYSSFYKNDNVDNNRNHHHHHHSMLPIRPNAIFTSNKKSSVPVKISTGQIFLRDDADKKILCGKKWQDASEKCPHADNKEEDDNKEEMRHKLETKYIKNRWQGIPSIATLWSDGSITLHGITATQDTGFELGMVELWNVNPFKTTLSCIDFVEASLLLVNDAPIGKYGSALILAAKYYSYLSNENDDDEEEEVVASINAAFDLLTGDMLWMNETGSTHMTSMDATSADLNNDDKEQSITDCQSLMHVSRGILHHSFSHQTKKRGSIERDTLLITTHIDLHGNSNEQNDIDTETKSKSKHTSRYWMVRYWAEARSTRARHQKHPSKTNFTSNAIVFHNRQGIDILSLKDGEHLCHQSLLENVFHADLNSNDIMEHLHFVSDSDVPKSSKHTCKSLIIWDASKQDQNTTLHLCEGEHIRSMFHQVGGVSASLPLIVETNDDRGRMVYDIVYALNIGIVKRFDIHGHCKWTSRAANNEFPSWDAASPQLGYMSRIASKNMNTYGSTSSTTTPFLLAGDDKIALYTIGQGRLLDQISLPQISVWKPILFDMNGDGTTDVLIATADGIWGYNIQITTIGSSFLWIMNTFLFLFLFIAFMIVLPDDSTPDFQRSTDYIPDIHKNSYK